MSYNPYDPAPTMPQTAAWPTEAPPTQVPVWGTDQAYGNPPPGTSPMGPPPAPDNKPSPGLIIMLVLLAVAAIGGGAFFVLGDDDETNTDSQGVADTDSSDDPTNGPVTTLPTDLEDIDVEDLPELPDAPDAPGGPELSVEEAAESAGPPEEPPTGDAQFDDLAEECYQGDMQACDDLYLETPVGSAYEAYGDTCGARLEDSHGYYCTDLLPNPEPPAD